MKRSILIGAALAVAVSLSSLTACGTVVAGNNSAGATNASSRYGLASSTAWAEEGASLRQSKLAQQSKQGGSGFLNAGDWASQSKPVDLTADGDYTFVIPVSPEFSVDASRGAAVSGFAVAFPPDTDFGISPSAPSVVDNAGTDHATLVLTMHVQGLSEAYPNYSLWVY